MKTVKLTQILEKEKKQWFIGAIVLTILNGLAAQIDAVITVNYAPASMVLGLTYAALIVAMIYAWIQFFNYRRQLKKQQSCQTNWKD